MLEVLLFSISISIDAFGYSVGFGSKNIKLTRIQFLILNALNSGILILFLSLYSNFTTLFTSEIVQNLSSILLLVIGLYNGVVAYRALFMSFKAYDKKIIFKNGAQESFFGIVDLFLLLLIFVFENVFSTFIFYSILSHPEFFVIISFCLHYIFFMVGFDLGLKIKKSFPFDTRFITFVSFVLMGLINFFE